MKKLWLAWAVMMVAGFARAEIIYSNDFTGASGLSPTNSVGIDPGISSTVVQTKLDGNGHLIPNAVQAGAIYRVQLAAASITTTTVKLTFEVKTPTNNWIGIGFQGENINKLNEDTANSGPWLMIYPTTVRLKGGTGASNDVPLGTALFTAGSVNTFEMDYNTNNTVDISLNGSVLANNIAVAHVFPGSTPSAPVIHYLQMQFFSTATDGSNYIDNVVVSTTTDITPPPISSSVIYSNNFSGTEFKADGIPAGYYSTAQNSVGGVLEATATNNAAGFKVTLTNLNLSTLTAIKVSADVKIPTTNNAVIFLGFGNESDDYNMNSAGNGMVSFFPLNRKIKVCGGVGTANEAASSAPNVYPTNSTFKAEFTYYTNNTVDVVVNGATLYAGLALTPTVGNTLDYFFLNLRQQNTEAAGGATFDNLVIEAIPVSTGVYTLTVNSGTGSGSYTNGQQVAITASNLFAKTFAEWIGDTQYLASVASVATNTVIMSTNAVTLTATYTDNLYALTVNSGTGGGSYTNGQQVLITASNISGKVFSQWTGDVAYVASVTSSPTTVTMPAQAVSLTATYIADEQYTTNGTPYSWLDLYGLTNHVADDILDQDLDGLKTWQEYIAGTDPTNSTSCLKVAQAPRNTVTWSPVSGRVYSVYWSTNLVKGFTNLAGASNIVHPQGSWTNTTPDAKVNHYQVKVQLP